MSATGPRAALPWFIHTEGGFGPEPFPDESGSTRWNVTTYTIVVLKIPEFFSILSNRKNNNTLCLHSAYSWTTRSHVYYLISIITSSIIILRTKKLWLREVQWSAQGHAACKEQSQVEGPHVRQRSCDYMPQIYATVVHGPQRNKDGHKKIPEPRIMCILKATQQHQLAIENSPSVSKSQVKSSDLMEWANTAHSKNIKHLHNRKSACVCVYIIRKRWNIWNLNPSEHNMFLLT